MDAPQCVLCSKLSLSIFSRSFRTSFEGCASCSRLSQSNKIPANQIWRPMSTVLSGQWYWLAKRLSWAEIYIQSCLQSWNRRRFFFFFFWKQPTISLSSRQAKHMAMSDSCCEVRWLWSLIEELTICKTKLSMIYCDNGGDDGLAKRASHQSCTKHIHAWYHFVTQLVSEDFVKLVHVFPSAMLSDMLTKSLPQVLLKHCLGFLGLIWFSFSFHSIAVFTTVYEKLSSKGGFVISLSLWFTLWAFT